ncbi:response regulator [Austwickia chelonae]|uniref:response regulator n=1 Tax=Austwickia chelonae TaxID=100225 RepID=UPI001F083A74|nr:response regulator transcription factor [Austwickia chelonae]
MNGETMANDGARRLRMVVVDDQELLRRGLHLLLESTGRVEVVAQAKDGVEALAFIAKSEPDAVLTDAVMPGMSGAQLIRECADSFPGLPVIVVSTFDTDEVVRDVLEAGAAGFLLKDVSPERIVEAVDSARDGGLTIDPRVASSVVLRPSRNPRKDPLEELTPSERDVALLIADGLSNGQIAGQLHLAPGTVKNYVSTVMRKTGLPDRTQVALFVDRLRRTSAADQRRRSQATPSPSRSSSGR